MLYPRRALMGAGPRQRLSAQRVNTAGRRGDVNPIASPIAVIRTFPTDHRRLLSEVPPRFRAECNQLLVRKYARVEYMRPRGRFRAVDSGSSPQTEPAGLQQPAKRIVKKKCCAGLECWTIRSVNIGPCAQSYRPAIYASYSSGNDFRYSTTSCFSCVVSPRCISVL